MQTICKVYTWYALIMQWQIWGYAKTHFTFEQKLFFWASTSVVACYGNSNLVWWQKKSCKEDEGSREGGNELLQYAVRDKNWKTNWFHFNCLLRYKAGTWTQETCTNKSALINGKKTQQSSLISPKIQIQTQIQQKTNCEEKHTESPSGNAWF